MKNISRKVFIKRQIADLLIDKKYVNDFAEIKIIQQTEDNPIIYKGPGSIYQDTSGNLILKVYHVYNKRNTLKLHNRNVNVGNFIGKEHYFKLNAFDMSGMEWFAKDVWVTEKIKIPSSGTVLEIPLKEIEFRKKKKKEATYEFELMAIGKFQTPPTEFIEYPNGSSSRSKHSVVFESTEIITICEENRLFVQINGKCKDYVDGFFDLVIEAIGVAIGQKITPSTISIVGLGYTSTRICSTKTVKQKINPPISTISPSDGVNFSDFVVKYISVLKKTWSEFYMCWFKIYCSTGSNLDNIALIQGAVIEGILKCYFSEYGAPKKEEIINFEKVIEIVNSSSEIETNIKKRVTGNILNMKNQNSQRALNELKEKGFITERMVISWKTQRNSLAHGKILSSGGLDKMQKVFDDSKTVLSLFYRLLFIHIGYNNNFIDYSSEGWPEISMRSTIHEELNNAPE